MHLTKRMRKSTAMKAPFVESTTDSIIMGELESGAAEAPEVVL